MPLPKKMICPCCHRSRMHPLHWLTRLVGLCVLEWGQY